MPAGNIRFPPYRIYICKICGDVDVDARTCMKCAGRIRTAKRKAARLAAAAKK